MIEMKSEKIKLKVNGEEKEYKLNPLAWEDFPKLMGVVSKLDMKGEETDIMKSLDEGTMSKIMELEYKMFKKSYPEMSETQVKEIVLENVFVLLEPLFSVNISK